MARQAGSQPTEVELEILAVLWNNGPSTARQIHNALVRSRATNYSTNVKMLAVMLDKGFVKRDDSVRPQIFRPAASQKATQTRLLRQLIQKAYDGSAGSLIMQALSTQKASKDELAEIRALLDQLEEDKT